MKQFITRSITLTILLLTLTTISLAQTTNIKEWAPIDFTGEEDLYFWALNLSDKETRVAWILTKNDCNKYTEQSIYLNNEKILDLEGDPIILSCEETRCNEESCYYLDLSNIKSINIDEEFKLGLKGYNILYKEIPITTTTPQDNITLKCGNNVCESDETIQTCWTDCRVRYDELTTCLSSQGTDCNIKDNKDQLLTVLFSLAVIIILYQSTKTKW